MNKKCTLIRKAKLEDLVTLKIFLPSEIPGFLEEVIKEFNNMEADWILAFDQGSEVGHLRIRWGGTKNTYAKQFVKKTPNIECFGIKQEYQSLGIGTKILKTAEELIKNHGYRLAGLSLEITNAKAKEFYLKRGYNEWDHGIYKVEWEEIKNGKISKASTINIYLIKNFNSN